MSYREFRCQACEKLLFKGILVDSEIEVKCRNCGHLNMFVGIPREELLCLNEGCPRRDLPGMERDIDG